MIDDDAILNRIAKTLTDNFEKFGWASTLGDKFEVWFQIEICLGLFGEWDESKFYYHPKNHNLKREVTIDNSTSYKKTIRQVDFLISADGLPIDKLLGPEGLSQLVYSIELKFGIPSNKEDAQKDIHHALFPAQISSRRNKFNDRAMSIFIINAQDTTVKGVRSFKGQTERIETIAKEKFPNWTMLRNSNYASPNFMIIAIVPLNTEGMVLAHCANGVVYPHPDLDKLLSYDQQVVQGSDYIMLD